MKAFDTFVLCRSKRHEKMVSHHIAKALGAYRVTPNHNPSYFPRDGSAAIINYGCGTTPIWWDSLPKGTLVLNQPSNIHLSSDKLAMFNALDRNSVPCVEWTTNHDRANTWWNNGSVVYARTVISGSKGKGIVLCGKELDTELLPARLYTREFPDADEYRVGIVKTNRYDDGIIHVAQKKRMRKATLDARNMAVPEDSTRNRIRTHGNGFVFAQKDLRWDDSIGAIASLALSSTGCRWGCVDLLVRWGLLGTPEIKVVETNTAPSIMLSSNSFRRYIEAMKTAIATHKAIRTAGLTASQIRSNFSIGGRAVPSELFS